VTLTCLSPAAVELSRGESGRAWLAVREAWRGQEVVADPDPYARFRRPEGRTDPGTVAYFLEYYAFAPEAAAAAAPPQGATLAALEVHLAELGLPVRRFAVGERGLPRVAALARLADGELAVVTQPRERGPVALFSAARGGATLPGAAADSLGVTEVLIPGPMPAELEGPAAPAGTGG
jgi:hypothetical protein